MKKNGYWRYSDIIENLKAKCKEINPVDLVEDERDDNSVITYKYYVLEDGLHVYVSDDRVIISDQKRKWDDQGINDLSISSDEDGVECWYADNKGNCITISFPNLRETTTRELTPSASIIDVAIIRGRNNVPADIGEILDVNLKENISPEMKSVCERIRIINDKLKGYERIEEIDDEETLRWLSLELNAYKMRLEHLKQIVEIATSVGQNTNGLTSEILAVGEDIEAIEAEIASITSKINPVKALGKDMQDIAKE